MQKEFIPYEQAVDLESIGFDIRPDFGNQTSLYNKEGIRIMYINYGVMGSGLDEGYIYAPLKSTVFRWFRKKSKLSGIPQYFTGGYYCYTINDMKDTEKSNRLFTEFESYEEAELACLKKLIDIVKNK